MKNLFIPLATAICFLLSFSAKAANPHDVRKLLDTNACVRCDLSFANLRGVNLRGADLRGVDFRGADLREANLENANIGWADLRGAKLDSSGIEDAISNDHTIGLEGAARATSP
ncbi:MAG: pentapeptide repeat-containing protein [Cyanobacteria bacterium J06621_11]